jgi:hypothetical protein
MKVTYLPLNYPAEQKVNEKNTFASVRIFKFPALTNTLVSVSPAFSALFLNELLLFEVMD